MVYIDRGIMKDKDTLSNDNYEDEEDEDEEDDNKSQIVATICLTLICCVLLATTHGEHGVGWFLAGLFLIWN